MTRKKEKMIILYEPSNDYIFFIVDESKRIQALFQFPTYREIAFEHKKIFTSNASIMGNNLRHFENRSGRRSTEKKRKLI